MKLNNNKELFKGQHDKNDILFFVKTFVFTMIIFLLFLCPIVYNLIQVLLLTLNISIKRFVLVEIVYMLVIYAVLPLCFSYLIATKRRIKYINSCNVEKKSAIKINCLKTKDVVIVMVAIGLIIFIIKQLMNDYFCNIMRDVNIRSYLTGILSTISFFVIVYCPILLFGFRRRCENCKLMFALKKLETKQYDSEDIQIKVENEIKNNLGEKIGTQEQWVNGKRVYYKIQYKCKGCGQIHYSTYFKDYIKK